jgi:methionine-rich copper-binding protein CopC
MTMLCAARFTPVRRGHAVPSVPIQEFPFMRLFPMALLPVLLLTPCIAFAHAHLKTAIPASGSSSPTPPQQVAITFTEGIEPDFSTIEVQTAAGAHVEDGKPHVAPGDNTQFIIGLKPLQPGVYTVTWHATAVDTHRSQGNFTFTVAQ